MSEIDTCSERLGASASTLGAPCVLPKDHDGAHKTQDGVFSWTIAGGQPTFHGYRRSPAMMELFQSLGIR